MLQVIALVVSIISLAIVIYNGFQVNRIKRKLDQ